MTLMPFQAVSLPLPKNTIQLLDNLPRYFKSESHTSNRLNAMVEISL